MPKEYDFDKAIKGKSFGKHRNEEKAKIEILDNGAKKKLMKFDWAGSLSHLKNKFSAVMLQKMISSARKT